MATMKSKPASLSTRIASGIAACSFAISAGAEIQLLPAGSFRAWDGRPADVPAWKIDATIASAVIADFNTRQNERVIDYEHQTLLAEKNGQPAPAAGWLSALEWRESGLWAVCSWTPRATEMIAAGEYKYISPVFTYNKQTGAVERVLLAAITNNPGLDGMSEVALSALLTQPQETLTMNIDELLESLRWLLNLPTLTTPEEVMAELNKAIAAIKADTGAAAATGIVALVSSLKAENTALRAANPDPAKYAPVEAMRELQSQVAALTADKVEREVGEVVSGAIAAGKLLPAQEGWARELGKSNMAALTAFIQTAQPVAALGGTQTQGRAPEGNKPGALADHELAMCTAIGIKPEDFAVTKAAGLVA